MKRYGGWAGKVLRVNLTTGHIAKEDTIEKYKDFLGGTGIGYKVLWDEVPAGTGGLEHDNKIIFGVGPLAGTGAPCNGRTAVTTLFPTCWPTPLVASGHMGGHFAAQLKYSGFDALIVEGRAERPVWISIADQRVEIKDARHLWGQGIRRTCAEISQELGPRSAVAAIGPAGENLVPMSVVMNSVSHSAGGVGAVLGSKNLKAVGAVGSGSIAIAGDKGAWEDLIKRHLSLLGANNNHVVPATPQPWSEYYDPKSRWVASAGLRWEAAEPPVDVGACDPHDLNRIAYRTNIAAYFLGSLGWRHTVRGNGCTACPIRCHSVLKVPAAARHGVRAMGQNTCVGLLFGTLFFAQRPADLRSQASLEACMVGMHLSDDLGIWCGYAQLQRDFRKLYFDGTFRKVLDSKEYNDFSWDKYEKGDPSFLFEILPRIAYKQGELGTGLGLGTGHMLERWGVDEADWLLDPKTKYWKMGHTAHHGNDDDGQCAALINMQYNRDPACHSHTNLTRNGLPIEVQKEIAAELWGSADAQDARADLTRMNPYKAKKARWALLRKELHDSLSLCNWMGPWVASPLRERAYRGDEGIESKLYSLCTGDRKSSVELDHVAERIFTLHRALTIRGMATREMRSRHDKLPEWAFHDPEDRPAFTKGTSRLQEADMETARDMFYQEMGWDLSSGAPSAETYKKLGLGEVAEDLAGKDLLPQPSREVR